MAMARQRTKPAEWPDERFKSETVAGKAFTAHAERPFDLVWGIERWGYEIHGQRGPQRFPVLDESREALMGKDGKPVVELHDAAILTGTGPGRGTRHIEANNPDWRLPVGLTLRRPFSDEGEALFRQMGLTDRYADTFEPLPDVLKATLLTECGVAPERLPKLTGPQIEQILRQHAPALGVANETPADDRPALTELEQEILFVLDERETLTTIPQMCKVLKERRTGGAESTAKQAVRHLRELGLVERPQTSDGRPTRKGCRITTRGKQYLTTS